MGNGSSSGTESPPASIEETREQQVNCTCYCLVNWIAPLPAPLIPALPNTIVTSRLIFQTEIETGEEFWTANVNEKTHVCGTAQVLGVNPQVLNLVHNTYRMTRRRSWFFGWGAWTPWGPAVNTGNYTNAQALGTSAPPALPECTAVGIACP